MTKTREVWLVNLAEQLTPLFKEHDFTVPANVRYSVGWPGGKNIRKVVGQCWYPEVAADKSTNIFVSPVQATAQDVAETMLHEMSHAVVGAGHGHKGAFVKVVRALGFTAPWTSTPATPELKARIKGILDKMDPYPHGKMTVGADARGPNLGPKQGTRLKKVLCSDCGYTIRVTEKWIEQGLPTCPCGDEMVEAE